MTQSEFREVLRSALLGAAAALEDDECDHPHDLREKLPTPINSPVLLMRCGACGEELEVPLEEIDDGSN